MTLLKIHVLVCSHPQYIYLHADKGLRNNNSRYRSSNYFCGQDFRLIGVSHEINIAKVQTLEVQILLGL